MGNPGSKDQHYHEGEETAKVKLSRCIRSATPPFIFSRVDAINFSQMNNTRKLFEKKKKKNNNNVFKVASAES